MQQKEKTMGGDRIERKYPNIENSTVIKTGWLCAHYTHGQNVPAWLHQTLAHIRQQASKGQLPVVVVPDCEQDERLVVITLKDFLFWSHRCLALNIPMAERSPYTFTSKEE